MKKQWQEVPFFKLLLEVGHWVSFHILWVSFDPHNHAGRGLVLDSFPDVEQSWRGEFACPKFCNDSRVGGKGRSPSLPGLWFPWCLMANTLVEARSSWRNCFSLQHRGTEEEQSSLAVGDEGWNAKAKCILAVLCWALLFPVAVVGRGRPLTKLPHTHF
jgi:hypothetical protein